VTGEVAKKLRDVPPVEKVSSHNLGIIATHKDKGERNYLMIPKFTPLPHEKTNSFGTTYDNQNSALVQVMEGGIMDDEETCDQLDCTKIGEVALDNIPAHPASSPIEVTYKYNVNGMLEVRAKDVLSGREIKSNIEHTGGLSEQEISEAKKETQKISVSG